ncbi:MAG: dipeptidase [Candidatus Heimdallarchaeota archaeon]
MGHWIDGHCDTVLKKFYEQHELKSTDFSEEFQATSDLLLEGGIDVQVAAMWIPTAFAKFGLDIALEMFGILYEDVQKDAKLVQIKNKSDFSKVQVKTKLGYILGLEGAEPIGNNLKLLPAFYELGIRLITLTWSRKNMFGEGVQKEVRLDEGEGLSQLGKQLVAAMNELGIVVDVAHLNRNGFQDVVKHSKSPFIASHTCAYSLVEHERNLSDEQIKLIAESDGCIGITFVPEFLVPNPKKEPATIEHVIEHLQYVVDLVGIDYVGLGSDFDGIDKAPIGLENASKFKELLPHLKEKGFSKKDIDKIMGENWHRVFRAVWTS